MRWDKGQMAAAAQPYHSRFGGMWIDRPDFAEELAQRLRARRLAPELADGIRQFERDGFHILRNAAPAAALDAFEEEISRAFREGREDLICQDPFGAKVPVTAGMAR